ncbi:hypothetical protein [Phage Phass-1]|uniref:Uncharacterized protein n=1 Tax=Phage Phass-1 TaxID=3043662 RepID=A0AAF0LZQ7_9CAUD|nr:hypothetical protein [Phage Phass-1]
MGKTFTRDQRKNNKYMQRDMKRKAKFDEYVKDEPRPKPKHKQKWRPHSETDVD